MKKTEGSAETGIVPVGTLLEGLSERAGAQNCLKVMPHARGTPSCQGFRAPVSWHQQAQCFVSIQSEGWCAKVSLSDALCQGP